MTAPRTALVIAGGLGSRLAVDRPEHPKPLLPVCGVPLLALGWMQLRRHGVEEIHFSLRHRAEELIAFVTDHLADGVARVHFHVEAEPLGTIGALALLRARTEPVLVVNADLLSGIDLGRLGAAHAARGSDLTIAVHWQRQRLELGEVACDVDGRVEAYLEKPLKEYRISSGTYVVGSRVLRLLGSPTWLPFPELVERALSTGCRVHAHDHGAAWLDVNDLAGLARAQRWLGDDPVAFGLRPEELDATVLRLGIRT